MLGRLCAIAAGAIFPPEIPRAAQRNSQGGWASSPNLPMSFQPCSSLNLETERSVNTQGKGNPEGEFKGEGQKQDKSRVSQVTPGRSQRPAVRAAFRAFTDRGRDFRNCLECLAGVRFWRLLCSKASCFKGLARRLFCYHRYYWQRKARFALTHKMRDSVCPRPKFAPPKTKKRFPNQGVNCTSVYKEKGAASAAQKICV